MTPMPLTDYAEKISTEQAEWMDSVIERYVPSWKTNILKKVNFRLLRKLLGIDIVIHHKNLSPMSKYKYQIIIKLNGKKIASRKFKI